MSMFLSIFSFLIIYTTAEIPEVDVIDGVAFFSYEYKPSLCNENFISKNEKNELNKYYKQQQNQTFSHGNSNQSSEQQSKNIRSGSSDNQLRKRKKESHNSYIREKKSTECKQKYQSDIDRSGTRYNLRKKQSNT